MRLVIISLLLSSMLLLSACESVQTRIDEKTEEENNRLQVYINKSVGETLIDFGQPFSDKKNAKGIREVTFKEKKIFGIKCIRVFTVDNSNIVTGFKSSGCY
jgi:hypothetical protein